MKKFLAILLSFLMLIPLMGAAIPSPELQDMIVCEPMLNFELAEEYEYVEVEGCELLEVLIVTLEEPCEKVTWHLLNPIAPEEEVYAYINDTFYETEITEDGGITVDFSDLAPGTYYLYFFRRVE